MNDTISREAVADAINGIECTRHTTWYEFYQKVMTAVEKLQPAEPNRGKWIRTGSGSLYDHYECSECGKAPKWECMGDNRWKIAFTDFCPNCGADMRQREE